MEPAAVTSVGDAVGVTLGRRLLDVWGEAHLIDGRLDLEDLVAVWLVFEQLGPLRFACAANAWDLQAQFLLPKPADMQELGETVICDYTGRSIFSPVVGAQLNAAWTLDSPAEGQTVGVQFDFGHRVSPIVRCCCDDLLVEESIPHALEFPIHRVPIHAAPGAVR